MLLIWYKFRHIKHSNTIPCKHFSIKSLCAFDTCWWYNKMAYNGKSLYFTLHWCVICFSSNRHFILVHLVHTYIHTYIHTYVYTYIYGLYFDGINDFDDELVDSSRNTKNVKLLTTNCSVVNNFWNFIGLY